MSRNSRSEESFGIFNNTVILLLFMDGISMNVSDVSKNLAIFFYKATSQTTVIIIRIYWRMYVYMQGVGQDSSVVLLVVQTTGIL
jgi:hypothetical protein